MKIDFQIRTFEEKDIDQIFNIETLCFATPWTKDSLLEELKNKFARYVVAVSNNIVIGYAGLWVIFDEGHITNIAVHPEFRGVKIGETLLKSLTSLCKKENVTSLTLEVRKSNIIAQNLYKKFGFVSEGVRKGYYGDNKEDALIMWNRNI